MSAMGHKLFLAMSSAVPRCTRFSFSIQYSSLGVQRGPEHLMLIGYSQIGQ